MIPFIEKYRPKKLDDMIGIDKEYFRRILTTPKSLPHFLLYSTKPGTGKTSLAKVIINELNADSLILNASDDRTIDVVRDKIRRFVETKSFNPDVPKIVFLDEVDGMRGRGDDTQMALRSLMESYPAKFILTCNNINKVIEPLQSRCVKLNLQFPPKEEILERLKSITSKESLTPKGDSLHTLVETYYPSVRDMLNYLYHLKLQGVNEFSDIKKDKGEYEETYKLILDGKLLDARMEWLSKGYQLREFLKFIFEESISREFVTIESIISLIAETDYRLCVHADPDITMFDFVVKYYNLVGD